MYVNSYFFVSFARRAFPLYLEKNRDFARFLLHNLKLTAVGRAALHFRLFLAVFVGFPGKAHQKCNFSIDNGLLSRYLIFKMSL